MLKWKGMYSTAPVSAWQYHQHTCVSGILQTEATGECACTVLRHYISHSVSGQMKNKVWHHMAGRFFVIHFAGPISVLFDGTHRHLL